MNERVLIFRDSSSFSRFFPHRLPIYVRHPQMLPDENNLDTAALAKRSIRHKYALENVQANAVNQTRGIF